MVTQGAGQVAATKNEFSLTTRSTPYACNLEASNQWPNSPNEALYYVDVSIVDAAAYTVFAISSTGAAVDGTGVFNINVVAAGLDPFQCEVSGPGRTAAVAGSSTSVRIVGRDAYGNRRTTGGSKFGIAATGSTIPTCGFTVAATCTGTADLEIGGTTDCSTFAADQISCGDVAGCTLTAGDRSASSCPTVDSCTSMRDVTTFDSTNCVLTATSDFGVNPGSCVSVDASIATCEYIVGTYTDSDNDQILDTVIEPDSCSSTLVATTTAFDTINCILTPTVDFGLTRGSCAALDESFATCKYVGGCIYSPDDQTCTGMANGGSVVVDNGDGTYDGVYTITEISTYDMEQRTYDTFQLSITLLESTPAHDIGQPGQAVGTEAARSPFNVFATPGQAFAHSTTKYTANGNDFTDGVAGQRYPVDIQLADRFGNVLTSGGDSVSLTAAIDGLPGDTTLDVSTTDNADGTYTVRYKFTEAASYVLGVLVNQQHVLGLDASVQISAATAAGAACVAEGDGVDNSVALVAGSTTQFQVLLYDQFSNPILDLSANYAVTARLFIPDGASCGQCAVVNKKTDRADGQLAYTVEYGNDQIPAPGASRTVDQTAGDISIAVSLNGVAIDGSPFIKSVQPSEVSVADTTASGNGINFMIADQEMRFDIEARDRFGNVAEGSNLNFDIRITRDTSLGDAVAVDSSVDYSSSIHSEFVNGKFEVRYIGPGDTGEYQITIDERSSNSPIQGSPFNNIVCDTTTDGAWVRAEPPNPSIGFVAQNGAEQWFKLYAYGSSGAKKLVGGDTFELQVFSGDAELLPDSTRIEDTNDGEYTVFYRATATIPSGVTTATFQLSVLFVANDANPTDIGGGCPDLTVCPQSPFSVSISAGAVSTNSSSAGSGLHAAVAGVEAEFSVQCLDWWGNARTDISTPGLFEGTLACDGACDTSLDQRLDMDNTFNDNNEFEFNLLPSGGGLYEGSYTLEIAGRYLLTLASPTAVNLFDDNIRTLSSSPTVIVVVPARSSAARSLCTGAGLRQAVAGNETFIYIQGIDEFGNFARDRLNVGPDGFSAELSTATEVVIINVGEGTHSGHYTETQAGTFSISVFLTFDGEPSLVDESPYQLVVVPAALSVGHCDARGAGTERPAAGEIALFYVQARDMFMNNRDGTDDVFEFVMKDDAGLVCIDGTARDACDSQRIDLPVALFGPKRTDPLGGGQYLGNYTVVDSKRHLLEIRSGDTDQTFTNKAHIGAHTVTMSHQNCDSRPAPGDCSLQDQCETPYVQSTAMQCDLSDSVVWRWSPYTVDVRSAGNFAPNCFAFGSGLLENARDACDGSLVFPSQADSQNNLAGSIREFQLVSGIEPCAGIGCVTCETDGAVAGESHSFIVQSVDKTKNRRQGVDAGADQFEFTATLDRFSPGAATYDPPISAYSAPASIESHCLANPGADDCSTLVPELVPGNPGMTAKECIAGNCINGTFVATFTATIAGQYELSVVSLGRSIHRSPYTATIVPAAYFGSTSTVVGAVSAGGPQAVGLGEDLSFIIVAKDRYGNFQTDNARDVQFHVYAVAPRSTCPECRWIESDCEADVDDDSICVPSARCVDDGDPVCVETDAAIAVCGLGTRPSSWTVSALAASSTITDGHRPVTQGSALAPPYSCPEVVRARYTDHGNGTFLVTYSSNIGGPLKLRVFMVDQDDDGVATGDETELRASDVDLFFITTTVEANPLVGPVQGGTRIRVKHAIWQLYSDSEIAVANVNREFNCSFALPDHTSVTVAATWVDMNEVECITPPSNASGVANVSLELLNKLSTSATRFYYYDAPSVHTILPSMARVLMKVSVLGTAQTITASAFATQFEAAMTAQVFDIPLDPNTGLRPTDVVNFLSADLTESGAMIRFFVKERTGLPTYVPDQDNLVDLLQAAVSARTVIAGVILTSGQHSLIADTSMHYGPSTGGTEVIFKGDYIADACVADHHVIGQGEQIDDTAFDGTIGVNQHGCNFCCRFGFDMDEVQGAVYDPADGQLKCKSSPRCPEAEQFDGLGDPCPGTPRTLQVEFSFNCQNYQQGDVTFSYFDVVDIYTPVQVRPAGTPLTSPWGRTAPVGPSTGDTDVIVRLEGINLYETEHLETACDFEGRLTQPRVDVTVIDELTLLCKSPQQTPNPDNYEHMGVSVEVTIDAENGQPDSLTRSNHRFRYYIPPELQSNALAPPIGPSYGGTDISIKGLNLEMGTNYTCRFGDEATGVVVQAKEFPDCTINPATGTNTALITETDVQSDPGNFKPTQIGEVRQEYAGIGYLGNPTPAQIGNNVAQDDSYAAEDPHGLDDTGVCSNRMVCSAVSGAVGTATVVTISLNGQQYTSTQQLFTYYGQTSIPEILDDGTAGIIPDRSPRNRTQEITVSYLYACGFQSEFSSWMQCKFREQQGRAPVEKNGEDIMVGAYVSDVAMSCRNPARGWVHDALLSIALNGFDFTEERMFIYYGDAIAMMPIFSDSAEAEFCIPACVAGNGVTSGPGSPETEFCDRYPRCLYQKQSDSLVDVGQITLETQDENANWVPEDIAVVGYDLIWFVTSDRPDRFQSFAPLNATGCSVHQRLAPPYCTPDNLAAGVNYISGAGPTGPCYREECMSGNVRIPCYVNETYERTTAFNRTGNAELEYVPTEDMHTACRQPIVDGRVFYPLGNLSLALPLTGMYTIHFVVDSKDIRDLAPAEVSMEVIPGVTAVEMTEIIQDDPPFRRVVGQPLALELQTRDLAGNLRRGAGSRAGGDLYRLTVRKLNCGPAVTEADKRLEDIQASVLTCDAIDSSTVGTNGRPPGQGQLVDCSTSVCGIDTDHISSNPDTTDIRFQKARQDYVQSTDLGDGSYTLVMDIPVTSTAIGLYAVKIAKLDAAGQTEVGQLVGSPFIHQVAAIDCCWAADKVNDPEAKWRFECAMTPTDQGDGCLCKAGYSTDTPGVLPCEPCAKNKYKPENDNVTCTDCEVNTYTGTGTVDWQGTHYDLKAEGIRGASSLYQCICNPEMFNVSLEAKVGCFDNGFEEELYKAQQPDPKDTSYSGRCLPCPYCSRCDGNKQIKVKPNYWASYKNLFMYRCPMHLTWRQCLGTNTTKQCREGFSGAMCSVCAADWIRTASDGCSACNAPSMSTGAMLAQFGALFAFACCAMVLMKAVRPEDMVKIKILIDFGQLLTSFAPTFQLEWPVKVNVFMGFFAHFNFDITILMKNWGCTYTFFATFYAKLLFATLIPMVGLVVIFTHWRVGQRGIEKKRKRAQVKPTQLECVVEDIDWRGNCMSRAFFMLALLYLKTSNTVIDAFSCRDTDANSFLRVDYKSECTNALYKSFLLYSLIMMCIYPIGIPVAFQQIMKHKVKGREDYYEIQRTFGFLYADFKRHAWWWGVFNLMRKLLLSGVLIFFKPGSPAQLMIAMVIGLCCLLLFTKIYPYVDSMNNMLDLFAQFCVFLTLFGAMMDKVDFGPQTKNSVRGDFLQDGLVMVNLGVPLLGAVLAIGSVAYEYRRYYVAKLNMIHGIAEKAGAGALVAGGAGLLGKGLNFFGSQGVDVSTSQRLLETARKHAAKCAKQRAKANRRYNAAEARVRICDEWLHLVEKSAADEADAERLFMHIEKSVMHTDNKTGAGKIQSVEEWWNMIIESRVDYNTGAAARLGSLAARIASIASADDADNLVTEYDDEDSDSSGSDEEAEDMEGGIVRPLHGVEAIEKVESEQASGAFTYIGTQGALAEADEAEHFVPTKEPVSYDWERMQKFRETMSGDATERHALEVKADLHNPKRPAPFHLRDFVEADGAGDVKEITQGKKKKKKKKTNTQERENASADDMSAAGSASIDVSTQPAQGGEGRAAEPESQPGEGVPEQGTVAAPPQRRRKKKAVAT
jgi:hypothetical protein